MKEEMKYSPLGADYYINIPPTFGNYKFKSVVGTGSSSVVVLAENLKNKKLSACKIIDRKQITKEGLFMRLEQELRVIEKLKHPNICEVEKILYFDDVIIVCMEYCPKGTLNDYIVDNQCLPNWEVKSITAKIVDALDFLHSKGIAHRDIKLDNIVLTENFEPKLIDFGLCTESFLNSTSFYNDNLRSTVCGTLEYMAPEILKNKPYDPMATDIWALGVVVYSMATGQFPWHGPISQIIKKILDGSINFPSMVHQSTKNLITEMLQKNPHDRPTAAQLKKKLEEMQYSTTPKIYSALTRPRQKFSIIKPVKSSFISKQNSFPIRLRI
jgi:serine/threonine protein kinase